MPRSSTRSRTLSATGPTGRRASTGADSAAQAATEESGATERASESVMTLPCNSPTPCAQLPVLRAVPRRAFRLPHRMWRNPSRIRAHPRLRSTPVQPSDPRQRRPADCSGPGTAPCPLTAVHAPPGVGPIRPARPQARQRGHYQRRTHSTNAQRNSKSGSC